MIIVALMAGYDKNAQTYFDGLYKMFDTHRSANNKYLMQWQIKSNEVRTSAGSATDGDMDIAYALTLASQQWTSTSIDYLKAAREIIKYGLKKSYIKSSLRLGLSDDETTDIYSSRPSDWMFGHFNVFKWYTDDVIWQQLSDNLYSILNIIQTNYSSNTGLIPDFIMYKDPKPAPPYQPQADEGANTGKYNYNACRVPLRVVIDYAHFNNQNAKKVVEKMVAWIKRKTNNDPLKIRNGYDLNGQQINSYDYADGVFLGPLIAASVTDKNNQKWLDDGWNAIKTLRQGYFSDSYKLLSMIFISGNWWVPI